MIKSLDYLIYVSSWKPSKKANDKSLFSFEFFNLISNEFFSIRSNEGLCEDGDENPQTDKEFIFFY